jgi:hypothetical protein
LVARQVERHFTSVLRELTIAGIMPAVDASCLGARIYRRSDMASFLASQGTPPFMLFNKGKDAPMDALFGNKSVISDNNGVFCESDDVIL